MYTVMSVKETILLVLLKSYADRNQVFYAKLLDVFLCSV